MVRCSWSPAARRGPPKRALSVPAAAAAQRPRRFSMACGGGAEAERGGAVQGSRRPRPRRRPKTERQRRSSWRQMLRAGLEGWTPPEGGASLTDDRE
ncbi:hypothetical protein R5R35_013166 [Gryllus longicercus]|uniref:Uncharacterized protein n=1 Tax=Gryllus longicercus TaxID=2509291 RepID=A0AAN9UZK8_9ORTH